jgi:hypothetical protein
MIDKGQLRDLITRVLKEANLYSDSAVELLMLTAACESKLGTYIRQVRGPARGIFQMEPATHDDLWENYLEYKPDLFGRVTYFTNGNLSGSFELEANLAYSIIMTRIHYLRIPTPLPEATDVDGMAHYWKKYYNTHLGKGTVAKAKSMYERYAV